MDWLNHRELELDRDRERDVSDEADARARVHARALQAAAGLARGARRRASARALLPWTGLVVLQLACGPLPEGVTTGSAGTESGTESASETDDDMIASTSSGDNSSDSTTLLTDATDWGTGGDGMSTGAATTTATSEATTDFATTTGEDSATTGDGATTGEELEDCLTDNGEVDWACCEAQDWLPAPQCTPWGPPAPPTARALSPRARALLALRLDDAAAVGGLA
ncbi:MAG: hypothetical protein H6713_02270 [Myxococcales bacterium]|nr:hypothetical protein [Myxococcales bacterium]